MLSLDSVLSMNYPTVWVQTNDQHTWAIDTFPLLSEKYPMYLYDGAFGLRQWSHEKNMWLPIVMLIRNPSNVEEYMGVKDIDNFALAVKHVQDASGYMLLFDADVKWPDLKSHIGIAHMKWMQGFRNNSLDNLKGTPRFLLLSSEPCPKELNTSCITLPSVGTVTLTVEKVNFIVDVLKQTNPTLLDDTITTDDLMKLLTGLSEAHAILMLGAKSFTEAPTTITAEEISSSHQADIRATSSLSIRSPKIGLDDIAGLDVAKDTILGNKYLLDNPEDAGKWGLSVAHRTLLLGIPGTGKSMIAEATASTLGWDLVQIGVAKSMDMWVGKSEQNIRQMFDDLALLAPVVGWIDEIGRDLSGGANGSPGDSGTTARVHGEFLTALQELPDNVMLMAAANALDHIAYEMLRAERWDSMFFVGFPAQVERMAMFEHYLREIEEAKFNYEQLAALTGCWTGAEIFSCIKQTKRDVFFKSNPRRGLTNDDLVIGIGGFKNRIWLKRRDGVVASYREALGNYDWASSFQEKDAPYIIDGKVPQAQGTTKKFAIM